MGAAAFVGASIIAKGYWPKLRHYPELCDFFREIERQWVVPMRGTGVRLRLSPSRYHDPDPISDRERRELEVPDGFGPLVPGVTYTVEQRPLTWLCRHCGSQGEATGGGIPCRACGARDTALYAH